MSAKGMKKMIKKIRDRLFCSEISQESKSVVSTSAEDGKAEQLYVNVQCTGNFPIFRYVQVFLLADLIVSSTFALEFLARMEVDNDWPRNIFVDKRSPFLPQGFVNTQNGKIWTTENPFTNAPIPLHSAKVTVECGLTASFIVGHISRR
ncbi:uncharacterized protein CEXT_430021 [Caerostris extrusa]|uniref:Uncharacterized protein n=1 Tax=Caerostris extrusa TaxID=172846 RepID=A0AAV4U572_CAEEX|nr:uncharacterized protein CEXT_430021 [Caerostris extrusa]